MMFALGTIVSTPGALEAFSRAFMTTCLARHHSCDWGALCDDDRAANDAAVNSGDRILSAYVRGKRKLWVITEPDRSITTFLLPEEY